MNLFARIRKVDEEKRLVFGVAAEEAVDKAAEIMDYMSSKPHFQKWSADISADTGGKNLGNVRAMHGKVAAGGLTEINFNDDAKQVEVCAKIVDDQEWKKVLAGTYTGFSIGGSYVGEKKVEKVDGQDVTRYTAKPTEISLVDRPCMTGAKFFEVQKADGTLQKVDFAPAPAEDEPTIQGTPEEVTELCKLMDQGGMSLGELLKAMPDFIKDKKKAKGAKDGDAADAKDADAKKDAKKTDAPADLTKIEAGTLRKNFYSCAELANLLACMQNLKTSAAWNAYYEGDKSPIPSRISAVIALAAQVLKEMIDEEVAEIGSGAGATLELAEKVTGLAKFEGDPLFDLLKIGARNSSTDKERIAKIHGLVVELGHECEGAAKAAATGDLSKVDAPALEKLLAEHIEPLKKALEAANGEITKLKAQPAPSRVSLRAIAKGEDISTGDGKVEKTEPIVDDHGEAHDAATLIKSIHQSGGRPFAGGALSK